MNTTMTTSGLATFIGMSGRIGIDGLMEIDVTVEDARLSYGTVHVLVQPVAGTGGKWTPLDKVTLASDHICFIDDTYCKECGGEQ